MSRRAGATTIRAVLRSMEEASVLRTRLVFLLILVLSVAAAVVAGNLDGYFW
jgi:hypothetical protein